MMFIPQCYVLREVNDVIIELFKETFDQIEAKIGQKYFQSFYEWGDNLLTHLTQMNVNGEDRSTLRSHIRTMRVST